MTHTHTRIMYIDFGLIGGEFPTISSPTVLRRIRIISGRNTVTTVEGNIRLLYLCLHNISVYMGKINSFRKLP